MIAFLLFATPANGQTLKTSGSQRPLILRDVPVRIAISQFLGALVKEPYVICDAALKDDRRISLNIPPYALKYPTLVRIFAQYGYQMRLLGGLIYVCNDSGRSLQVSEYPLGNPLSSLPIVAAQYPQYALPERSDPTPRQAPDNGPHAGPDPVKSSLQGYHTRYLRPSDLKRVTSPFFPTLVIDIHDAPGAVQMIFAQGDVETVDRWLAMVGELDVPNETVEVQAILFETTNNDNRVLGVSSVLNAIGNGLGFSVSSTPTRGDALTFRAASFQAVLSAVNNSGRSKIVSAPRLSGKSCEKLTLQVGQDVPTLGSVSLSDGGRATQSVEYRRSGVLLEVTACVAERVTSVKVRQEFSSFAVTETGVNDSPTLSTRVIETSIDLDPDQWAIMGGLVSDESTETRSSLFGLIPTGKAKRKASTELVLLLNVRRSKILNPDPINTSPQ